MVVVAAAWETNGETCVENAGPRLKAFGRRRRSVPRHGLLSVTQLPSTPLSYLLKHKVQVILCGSLFFHPLDLSGRGVEAGSHPSGLSLVSKCKCLRDPRGLQANTNVCTLGPAPRAGPFGIPGLLCSGSKQNSSNVSSFSGEHLSLTSPRRQIFIL